MLVNYKEICELAWLESSSFDKEGFLFVQEAKDSSLQQWKCESFVERLCRLRGNILFILDITVQENQVKSNLNDNCQDNEALDDKIVDVIILEECVVKLTSEDSNKHYCFFIDFGKSDSTKSLLFATPSQLERNSWVDQIRFSSFAYLRSLYKIYLNHQSAYRGLADTNSIDAPLFSASTSGHNQRVLKFSIFCSFFSANDNLFKPSLYVSVYYRENGPWNYLDKSEIISSKECKFAKQFHLSFDSDSSFELKFSIFNVIERVTETKILVGECLASSSQLKNEDNEQLLELEIYCTVKESEKIGLLRVSYKSLHGSNFSPPSNLNQNEATDKKLETVDKSFNLISLSPKSANKLRSKSLPDTLSDGAKLANLLLKTMPLVNANLKLNENIFTNIIYSSFQFDLPLQSLTICLVEMMAETRYCFSLPQAIINVFVEDEEKLINSVTNSLGEVNCVYQKAQIRVVDSHLRFFNLANESINSLNKIHFSNKNFRSSLDKNQIFLQFVPINFHLQRFLVTKSLTDLTQSDNTVNNHLDIWSVGAFTSHYLGYEDGGLHRLYLETRTSNSQINLNTNQQAVARVWKKMKDYFKLLTLSQLIEANMIKLISSLGSQEKVDNLFKQIKSLTKSVLLILDSAEVDQILRSLDTLKSVKSNKSKKSKNSLKLEQSVEEVESTDYESVDLLHHNLQACLICISSKLNYLSQLEQRDLEPISLKLKQCIDSLKSLASICYAVEIIKLEKNQLEAFYNFKLRRSMLFSQALTALIISVCEHIKMVSFQKNLVKSKTILVYIESLLSCSSQELGMFQDMCYAVEEINQCVNFVFINSQVSDSSTCEPKIEGNSHNLRVFLSIDSEIIPNYFECKVCLLIFNIGINDHSNFTEAFVDIKFQENTNRASSVYLEKYINQNLFHIQYPELNQYLLLLKKEVWSHKVKNVSILHIMEQITRTLSGIRMTSCKSAKDRTSMAITLEEVRLCSQLFNFNEIDHSSLFQQMLDTLRSEGTRRENTRKNIGISKYAFNFFQVCNSLPKLYRPPPGTYSNVLT